LVEKDFEFDDQPSEATQWAEEATDDDEEFAELDDEDLEDLGDDEVVLPDEEEAF